MTQIPYELERDDLISRNPDLPAELLECIDIPSSPVSNPCWIWKGKTKRGYATIRIKVAGGHVNARVHRVTYALQHRSIDSHLEASHLCHTPACCNPMAQAFQELGLCSVPVIKTDA